MKTKQEQIKAKFTNDSDNGYQYDKPVIAKYLIIDKTTEKTIVDCRLYMSASRSASTVYASLWVSGIKNKPITRTSGHGSAGGWGYDKESSAIGAAIEDAGIELYGTPYRVSYDEKIDFKRRAYIGGTGEHGSALLAIAYAAGYRNCILAKM